MKNDLISIIIPVWNVENYLDRCLMSVVNQSYENIEIILVDDGSTDNSPKICEEWHQRDNRIRVFHKENGGASSARNYAFDNLSLQSKYTIFIDSDDYIYPDSVSLLHDAMVSEDLDFVSNYKTEKTLDLKKDHDDFLEYITTVYSYGPVEKIYRTDFILDNGLRFDSELKTAEDALFVRQYLALCNKIKLINEKLYFYFQGNANSLTKKGYVDYCLYYKYKLDALEILLEHMELPEDKKDRFLSERGIHGIKVSLEHYYRNFDTNEYKHLGKRSVELIYPYITVQDNIDPKLKKWLMSIINQKSLRIRWFNIKCMGFTKKVKTAAYKVVQKIKKHS